jgi:hypothetical protein
MGTSLGVKMIQFMAYSECLPIEIVGGIEADEY